MSNHGQRRFEREKKIAKAVADRVRIKVSIREVSGKGKLIVRPTRGLHSNYGDVTTLKYEFERHKFSVKDVGDHLVIDLRFSWNAFMPEDRGSSLSPKESALPRLDSGSATLENLQKVTYKSFRNWYLIAKLDEENAEIRPREDSGDTNTLARLNPIYMLLKNQGWRVALEDSRVLVKLK